MLPSPPHCATSRPPGLSAARRRLNSRSWSAIQWKVAVERIASSGLSELELEQVAGESRDFEPLAPSRSRAARVIDSDASTAMTRPRGRRSRSASVIRPEPQPGVEHGLIAVQLEAIETVQAKASIGPGDAVVAGAVPLTYWHTVVRYHVLAGTRARPAASRTLRELTSLPGDRGARRVLGGLDHEPGAGDGLGVRLAHRQRVARVGLVAAGDTTVGTAIPSSCVEALERTRTRHHFQGVGHRRRVLVGRQALAQDGLDRAPPALGHRRPGHTPRRSPPPRPRAGPPRARPSARARRSVRASGRNDGRDQRERRAPARAARGPGAAAVWAPIEAPARIAGDRTGVVDHRGRGRWRDARSRSRASGAGLERPWPRAS